MECTVTNKKRTSNDRENFLNEIITARIMFFKITHRRKYIIVARRMLLDIVICLLIILAVVLLNIAHTHYGLIITNIIRFILLMEVMKGILSVSALYNEILNNNT